MVTEDYVSFEIAKLLKEKGFDLPFYFFYRTDDRMIHHVVKAKPLVYDNTIDDEVISAPTLQMAMKWLRETYKLFICIVFIEDEKYYGYTVENLINGKYLATSRNTPYKTYEQATQEAIKYCLENLI